MPGEKFGAMDAMRSHPLHPRKPLSEGCPEYDMTGMIHVGDEVREGVEVKIFRVRMVCRGYEIFYDLDILKEMAMELQVRSEAYTNVRRALETELIRKIGVST